MEYILVSCLCFSNKVDFYLCLYKSKINKLKVIYRIKYGKLSGGKVGIIWSGRELRKDNERLVGLIFVYVYEIVKIEFMSCILEILLL